MSYAIRVAMALVTVTITLRAEDLEQRIESLLARMNFDEKIGQMSQSTSLATPISDRIKEQIRNGRWGSFLNAGDADDRFEAQRIALKESRLGIPLLFGRDVIHGYRTIFPIPLGQSASWDPELIRMAAREAAGEASSAGIHWTFAPMIDITRDPRWGRVAETLGEDPYLTGVLGSAMLRGFQGASLADPRSLAACAKHYAGYGAAEGGRDYNSAWIPEILLREVYLRPFRAAKEAGVASLMSAFNALNGIPATGNQLLLRQIARSEWKFDGMVVSDYNAVIELIQHGYAADARDAARKALRAGVDMEMVSTAYYDHLKSLVESRDVETKWIDDAVRNILRLKFRLGLFDGRPQEARPETLSAQALSTARRLAAESVVLLKNRSALLPLSKTLKRVAVIGPLADSPVDQMGTWSMDGRKEDVRTPLASLRSMLGPGRVAYAPALSNSRDTGRSGFGEALRAARASDVVLLFLGEEAILSGEARSRAFLDLPGAQEALVHEIKRAGKPIVLVILAGRPLTFHSAAEDADAILYAWHPGTMGGPAIVDLLFGDSIPSGKLTITFPRTVGQVPIYYAHLNTGRPPMASELGIPLGNPANPSGYTSKYIDVDFTPEHPFGYGLSYTTFEYSAPRVSAPAIRLGDPLAITGEVANVGEREADEVVQLYISGPRPARVCRPVRQLAGFQRIRLRPGERRRVEFALTAHDFAFYDENLKLVTEPGAYEVWIAPDSARGIPAGFTLR